MFDLRDAYDDISLDDIKSKVSEYEIWKHYCRNFEELDKSFLSELYDDSRPSCRIYRTADNILLYKDFGTGKCYNCYNYIQIKYGCTFKEALRIIATDFNISKSNIGINPNLVIGKETFNKVPVKSKSIIDIVSQQWTITDYDYWSQYGITLDLLNEYDVFSVKHVFLHKYNKPTIFNYTKDNPIYAYRFVSDNRYAYKIYFPKADKKYKWLFSGSANDIEGFDQLPLHGDMLILTKSLKDVMCYRMLGYSAISLQGEANKLDAELVRKLLKRFNQIIVNYDNDDQGIKSTEALIINYNFKHFYIDDAKDLSDYIKIFGINKAKEIINGKIRERRDNRQSTTEEHSRI